jgi:hypothetical protein
LSRRYRLKNGVIERVWKFVPPGVLETSLANPWMVAIPMRDGIARHPRHAARFGSRSRCDTSNGGGAAGCGEHVEAEGCPAAGLVGRGGGAVGAPPASQAGLGPDGGVVGAVPEGLTDPAVQADVLLQPRDLPDIGVGVATEPADEITSWAAQDIPGTASPGPGGRAGGRGLVAVAFDAGLLGAVVGAGLAGVAGRVSSPGFGGGCDHPLVIEAGRVVWVVL